MNFNNTMMVTVSLMCVDCERFQTRLLEVIQNLNQTQVIPSAKQNRNR